MVWGILFVGVSELCEDSVINVYFNDNSLKNNVFCHLSPALIQGYTKRLHLKQSCLLDTLPVTVSTLHGKASLKKPTAHQGKPAAEQHQLQIVILTVFVRGIKHL